MPPPTLNYEEPGMLASALAQPFQTFGGEEISELVLLC